MLNERAHIQFILWMRKWSRISINNGKWFRRVMILCWLILNWLMTGKTECHIFFGSRLFGKTKSTLFKQNQNNNILQYNTIQYMAVEHFPINALFDLAAYMRVWMDVSLISTYSMFIIYDMHTAQTLFNSKRVLVYYVHCKLRRDDFTKQNMFVGLAQTVIASWPKQALHDPLIKCPFCFF